MDYVKAVKIHLNPKHSIWGQLAGQFPVISIFSGKAKERTTAAKETLLQICSALAHQASLDMQSKDGKI